MSFFVSFVSGITVPEDRNEVGMVWSNVFISKTKESQHQKPKIEARDYGDWGALRARGMSGEKSALGIRVCV